MNNNIKPLLHPEVRFWETSDNSFAVFNPINRGILKVNRMILLLLMEMDGERTMDKMLSDIYKSYNLKTEYDEDDYREYSTDILKKFLKLGLIKDRGNRESFPS